MASAASRRWTPRAPGAVERTAPPGAVGRLSWAGTLSVALSSQTVSFQTVMNAENCAGAGR